MKKNFYTLESYRKSFDNQAFQLFKETFFQLIEDLDLEQLYEDLNQIIQKEFSPHDNYRIINKNNQPGVRIGELENNYGNLELIPLERQYSRSKCKNNTLDLKTIVIRDNIRLTRLVITFKIDISYLSIEQWIISENESLLKWDGEIFEADSKEYSYLLWLFATIGDYFYDFEK